MSLDEKYIDILSTYFIDKPVLKAYLFGSYLNGEADENSDIDILVDLEYIKNIGFAFLDMQMELEELLNKKVDLVSSKGLSKYLKPSIDKQKRLIYAR